MKVLVIGGTYFLGRVFTMFSNEKYDLTLVNRGRYSMKDYHVKEIHFDRHNKDEWKKVHGKFDAVVDFCAYDEDDIRLVLDNIDASIKKYIYISTVDVYERGTNKVLDETGKLEERRFGGEMGAYIYGKILLEKELEVVCKEKNIDYVSLRLSNLYGPFNYSPRETELIRRIALNEPLYHLTDAKAKFQLLYVKDAALAIQQVIDHDCQYHAYNIVDEEVFDYDDLNFVFSQCSPVNIITMSIDEAKENDYPLVYPIYPEEQEIYHGERFKKEFNYTYTPMENGMMTTFKAAYPIFKK